MQFRQELFVRQFGELHTYLLHPTFSVAAFASCRAMRRAEVTNAVLHANVHPRVSERPRVAHFSASRLVATGLARQTRQGNSFAEVDSVAAMHSFQLRC